MAPNKLYDQVPLDRFRIIRSRYEAFVSNLSDPDSEVVKVFDTLSPKSQEELLLIREVSRELQEKKDEDMRKAEQAAKEAEAEAELQKSEETSEEVKENEAETTTDSVEVQKVEK
ncbi:uncharacterized protein [Choristoneura fumiferana]|uniref:uncharacterized protein n=1 Tax=Choristoneura fumiferana TaxID=7141 RepID=UPI003D157B76